MTTGPIGPGTVLAGRYRLEDLLAETDGARFWRATDLVLARNVAVHAVTSDDARSPALLEAARISATFSDPHLLRVLDCDDSDGVAWVVNEWGEGISLDLMLQRGTLPPSRAAWLTREVAEAIAAGHAAGVAHGRLNPESVLLTDAGTVKLIGYVVDASLEAPATPDPMYGDVDEREADVINLAGILYAALTGRWPGIARSSVPEAPRDGRRPLRPRQVRAGVPRTLDAVCDRVLCQEGSRHALPIETAQEVAAALADFVGDPAEAAPLEPSALLDEPTAAIAPGDLTPSPRGAGLATASAATAGDADTGADTGDLEATQLSSAVPADAEAGESTGELDAAQLTARIPSPPPPPFEDLPERPLFADTARRVPRGADPTPGTGPDGRPTGGWSSTADGEPATGTGTGESAEFWPFVDAGDLHNDVHTGKEGRGWLRIGVLVAVLLALVVALAVAFNQGRHDGGPGTSGGASSSASPTVGARIKVAKASAFDPLGDGSENDAEVGNVLDGDPATSWQTSTYYNNPALGGLKPGVGVLLDLGSDKAPRSVSITFKGQPTDVEVYAASAGVTQPPDALDQLDRVGSRSAAPQSTTIRIDGGTRTRYLLVWLTKLPPAPGGHRG
ncbi:MAG: hypothetical protein JOZ82_03320, partial [Marmoricola sp.]|nr:hypothetical protein [Marmoricola sp.]